MTDSYHFQIEPEPRVEAAKYLVSVNDYFTRAAEQANRLVFPSGAAVLTSGDKIVGRVEAQTLANGLTAEETDATASVMGIVGKRTEPNRAPLPHFNQRTEFDPFPDYVVFHEFEPVAPLHTSPTTDSAYPAIAGLLRG